MKCPTRQDVAMGHYTEYQALEAMRHWAEDPDMGGKD